MMSMLSMFVHTHQTEIDDMMTNQGEKLKSLTLYAVLEACGGKVVSKELPTDMLREVIPIVMRQGNVKNVYNMEATSQTFRDAVKEKRDAEFMNREAMYKDLKLRALQRFVRIISTPSSFGDRLKKWPTSTDMTSVVVESIHNCYTCYFFKVLTTQTNIRYDEVKVLSIAITALLEDEYDNLERCHDLSNIIKHIFDTKRVDLLNLYNSIHTLFSCVVYWLIHHVYKKPYSSKFAQYHDDLSTFAVFIVGKYKKVRFDEQLLKNDILSIIQQVRTSFRGSAIMYDDDLSKYLVACKQSMRYIKDPIVVPLQHILDTLDSMVMSHESVFIP